MDLTKAIRNIIDGNAVILMGAGASYGAKNMYGELPSASTLSKSLYGACNIEPDDINDLQDAAQIYLEEHSATELIKEIRYQLTCVSYEHYHTVIYQQPWMRYYTTNYDDVAFQAAKAGGVKLTSVTIGSDFKRFYKKDHLCIHINGNLNNLTEESLHSEFKLTTESYLSSGNLVNSQWGALLTDDLDAAKAIVVLGLSLKYDLDLSRIIFSPELREKTIIIDSPKLSLNRERSLSRFGTVYKIGISEFASEIEKISENYIPSLKIPMNQLYVCFDHEFHHEFNALHTSASDVYKMFFAGAYSRNLFEKRDGRYQGFVFRGKFQEIKNAILDKKKYIFLVSDMGNGKTACINELRFWLSKTDYHVFTLVEPNVSYLHKEIIDISLINVPTLVIIDDYTNYIDVLRSFSLRNCENVQFLFAARTAMNYSRFPDVCEMFSVKENESATILIDKLSHSDIVRCVELFDRYGTWGKKANMNVKEKIDFLKNRNHGSSQFQSIMVDVIESDNMINRIEDLVKTIRNKSESYHEAVIMILVTQIMNLRVSPKDIERVTGQSVVTDDKFRTNHAIKELLDFSNNKVSFAIKSPVTAKLILQKIANPKMVIGALYSLANYAIKYREMHKFDVLLINIISFSHISSFLREFENFSKILAEYYDTLGEIEYYRTRNFYWLQYGISCIEIGDFKRAQNYLDNAYALVPKGFIPFQINNQQARLCLELIKSGESKDPLADYKKAHNLLMLPISSPKDNEYNVVKLFGYYTRMDFTKKMATKELTDFHKSACRDAFNRLSAFVKKQHDRHSMEFADLLNKLLKSSLSS